MVVSDKTSGVALPALALPPSERSLNKRSLPPSERSLNRRSLPPPAAQKKDAPRLRLEFLDGLRGLAALYVVLSHICLAEFLRWNTRLDAAYLVDAGLSHRMRQAMQFLQYGHQSVVVFIVLSGFSLMLPVARSADGTLKGGALGYLKRRALRILPPYYAALGLSLLLIALVPGMHKLDGGWWHLSLPAFTRGTLVSHLLLIQNLSGRWFFKIDAPMWSVASEWQIYFFFPLLLLPVWKRFGTLAAVAAGLAASVAVYKSLHQQLDCACPWFIGSFALGMAAASVCFSCKKWEIALRQRMPWGVLSLVCALAFAVLSCHPHWVFLHTWQCDMLISLFAAFLLVFCARHATTPLLQHRPWVLRLLETRGPQSLGRFSYSLYLTHFPVLGLMDLWFRIYHFSPVVHLALLVFAAVPVCILAAYAFYLTVERHFIPGYAGEKREAEKKTLHGLTFGFSRGEAKKQVSAKA